jgi:TrmH family RNA methyltransferase
MQRITSRHNPIVARYRAAARGDAADDVLLDGMHLVSDAVDAGVRLRHVVVLDAGDAGSAHPDLAALASHVAAAGAEVVAASRAVIEAISPVHSASPIVALAERPHADGARFWRGDAPLIVVAVDVQDPGNVGAIVRVAEATGAAGVVAAGATADPLGWKALRGSMGSALRLPVRREPDPAAVPAEATRHRSRLVATVPRGGDPPDHTAHSGSLMLLIGGEGGGLPSALVEAADARVTIPMAAPVESLNAAVAAAVILYEARRQRLG